MSSKRIQTTPTSVSDPIQENGPTIRGMQIRTFPSQTERIVESQRVLDRFLPTFVRYNSFALDEGYESFPFQFEALKPAPGQKAPTKLVECLAELIVEEKEVPVTTVVRIAQGDDGRIYMPMAATRPEGHGRLWIHGPYASVSEALGAFQAAL